MKRILAQVLLLAACVLLSACMELTSVITVAKDGSATIEETVLVSAQLKAMMSAGGADQPGSPSLKDIIPDKAKAEARAKKLGDGVTVKSYEALKMPDGREGVKVVYAVEDITDVEYEPFDSGKPEGKEAQPVTFDLDDNELTVSMPEEKKDEKPAETPKIPKEQMEQQMAMMKPMFAGMHIAFKIKAANGIVTTDASHVKGDTVTLMEMDFDKIVGNPAAFGKFMETADDKNMTPAKAAKVFEGVDGIQFEGKKEFSISLK